LKNAEQAIGIVRENQHFDAALKRISDPVFRDADPGIRSPLPFIRITIVGGCTGRCYLNHQIWWSHEFFLGYDTHTRIQHNGGIRPDGCEANIDVGAAKYLA
jgi:hypothetical protein